MRRLGVWIVLGAVLGLLPVAHAGPVQIIQASDLHSQYNHTLPFLRAVDQLRAEFRARHPDGISILLLNGDVSGPSEWTELDRGETFYRMMSHFSNLFEGFAFTMGNHDGWSFTHDSPLEGNRLFAHQAEMALRHFAGNSRHSGQHTTANLILNPDGEKFFRPFVDVALPRGERIRIVGLVGDDILSHSSYDPNTHPNPIRSLRSGFETAKEEILRAAENGIERLVFMAHEGSRNLETWIPQLRQWQRNHADARVRALRLPVFFAAHTHLVVSKDVAGVPLFESGSRYQFAEVILSEDGSLQSHRFFDYAEQKDLSARNRRPSPALEKALAIIEPVIDEMTRINSRIVFESEGMDAVRKDLRAGPHWFGTALANALREAALRLAEEQGLEIREAFGLFSSSAFRRDEGIGRRAVTVGDLKSFHPLPKEITFVLVTGRQLRRLVGALRQAGHEANEYSPQLSSNLIEDEKGELFEQAERRHRLEKALRRPLADQALYLVAIDGFNGKKAQSNPKWLSWTRDIRWLSTDGRFGQTQTLVDNFPKVYFQPDILRLRPRSCGNIHRY